MIHDENAHPIINISRDRLIFVVNGGNWSSFTFIIVELKIDVDDFIRQDGFVNTKVLTQWNKV